ncbi:MAG: ribbon-helix-helix protein, CopG family [Nitrososphaerota archaeon]
MVLTPVERGRRIKVSLAEGELSAIREMARSRGVTVSQIVREAVRMMLERERRQEELLEALRREIIGIVEGYETRVMETLEAVRYELSELKERVSSMEERVSALSARPESASGAHPVRREPVQDAAERVEVVASATSEEMAGLPSFLRDNPWVELLSRKGRA